MQENGLIARFHDKFFFKCLYNVQCMLVVDRTVDRIMNCGSEIVMPLPPPRSAHIVDRSPANPPPPHLVPFIGNVPRETHFVTSEVVGQVVGLTRGTPFAMGGRGYMTIGIYGTCHVSPLLGSSI